MIITQFICSLAVCAICDTRHAVMAEPFFRGRYIVFDRGCMDIPSHVVTAPAPLCFYGHTLIQTCPAAAQTASGRWIQVPALG